MSKFAFAGDSDFKDSTLLDYNGKTSASAYNWVVPANDLGVRDAQLYDLCGNATNLAAYSKYGDSLLRGSPSGVLKPETPLGIRYFMPAAGDIRKRCSAPDGTMVDQYYVVDGLSNASITSKSGSPPHTGNSIVFSAAAILNNIDPARVTPFYHDNGDENKSITFIAPENDASYNKCKKIQIVKDSAGNTESNYVSERDAERLIKSGVAKEGFHTYQSGSQPAVVHGHDGVWSRYSSGVSAELLRRSDETRFARENSFSSANGTHLGGGYFIGAVREPDPRYIHPKDIVITPMHSSYATIDDPDDVDYARIQQWLQDQIDMREESRESAKKGYDAITGFFLGSVTVLGLFIVFRFLDIQSAVRTARR